MIRQTISVRIGILLALLIACGATSFAQTDTAVSGASIRKVETRSGASASVAKGVNSPQGRYLPKFFDTVSGVEENVFVEWDAPAMGLGARATLSLDYTTAGSSRKQKMVHAIAASAAGPQSTTFTIPHLDSDPANRIASWRVRLMDGGRVLAEKQSTAWK